MSSAFLRSVSAMAIGLVVVTMGCEREARRFSEAPSPPDVRAQAEAVSEQQAGPAGHGMREIGAAGIYNEDNAYALAQGKIYYRWFNCIGCHAQGGGGAGPPPTDSTRLYGKEPGQLLPT